MSYYAAALTRSGSGWSATEIELDDAPDVEAVGDQLRDIDPDADLALLMVEADDEYFAVVRVDETDELRVFGSDAEFADASRIGKMLLADVESVPAAGSRDTAPKSVAPVVEETIDVPDDEAADDDSESNDDTDTYDDDLDDVAPPEPRTADDDTTNQRPIGGNPVGDAELFADLGTSRTELLKLCTDAGMLPSDVIAEVCVRAGCGDTYDDLRDL